MDIDCEQILNWLNNKNIKSTFYEYATFLKPEEIYYIWKNVNDITKCYKLELNKFIDTFNICDDNTRHKIIINVNINYISILIEHKLLKLEDAWDNKDINIDLSRGMPILKYHNIT